LNSFHRYAMLAEPLLGKESIMAGVPIRVLKSGPYEVSGGAKLFDHQGKEYQEARFPPIYNQPSQSIDTVPVFSTTTNSFGPWVGLTSAGDWFRRTYPPLPAGSHRLEMVRSRFTFVIPTFTEMDCVPLTSKACD
jgi:hypothetical protein